LWAPGLWVGEVHGGRRVRREIELPAIKRRDGIPQFGGTTEPPGELVILGRVRVCVGQHVAGLGRKWHAQRNRSCCTLGGPGERRADIRGPCAVAIGLRDAVQPNESHEQRADHSILAAAGRKMEWPHEWASYNERCVVLILKGLDPVCESLLLAGRRKDISDANPVVVR